MCPNPHLIHPSLKLLINLTSSSTVGNEVKLSFELSWLMNLIGELVEFGQKPLCVKLLVVLRLWISTIIILLPAIVLVFMLLMCVSNKGCVS